MEVGRDDILEQLERILHSRAIEGSDNLKSFLEYIVLKSVNGAEDDLKQYTIATEVFGLGCDFSPRDNSVVRVQASRLRRKLKEYYATEGKSDKVLIELPKGHYHPAFSFITNRDRSQPALTHAQENGGGRAQVTAQHAAAASPARFSKDRKWIITLGVMVALLSVVTAMLAISNRSLSRQLAEAPSQNNAEKLGPVWQPFLDGADKTLLVLSNPTVYRFINPMDTDTLLKRSILLAPEQVNLVNRAAGSAFLSEDARNRIIISTDEYTGMGEAIGLARITGIFRAANRSPILKQSRTVSPEDLKNHNVILLGSVWVNEWSGKLPVKEHLIYTRRATIVNNDPKPGEEREYGPKFDDDGNLIEDYGLITVKPNIFYNNTVMVLAGIHSEGTEAAAEYATSPDYLKNLNDRLLQMAGSSGPPKYYQALLKVVVYNGIPTTISLISLHEIHARND